MDDTRFARLEIRVDEIKDDISELKADSKFHREVLKDIKEDLKSYTVEVSNHVAGDNKIITEIMPLLRSLPDIIADYTYEKKKKEERNEKLKSYGTKLGLVSVTLGIIYTTVKLLSDV